MRKKTFVIKNQTGVHAKIATDLVDEASKYDSDILIGHRGRKLDMKSIICVMGLGINYNDEITIQTYGDDESEAIDGITKYIVDTGLGQLVE